MANREQERLALELQEELEERARLRTILEQALGRAVPGQERHDIQRLLDFVNREMTLLARRLERLRSTGGAGTG